MDALVSPDDITKYGFPKYSNRHRRRLEERGVLPRRVPINANHHAYLESELLAHAKTHIDALIAKRDAGAKAKPLFPQREAASSTNEHPGITDANT
jgi:hypothetical protein